MCTIIHPITFIYNAALADCKIESLKLRRNDFQKKFFEQISIPQNSLHHLLLSERDPFSL